MPLSPNTSATITLLLLIGLLFVTPSHTLSQNNRQNENQQDFSMPSAIYIVDEVGVRINSERFPMEGSIDPESYRVGSGDLITVTIRGAIPVTYRALAVSAGGYLAIPGVGSVFVDQLTLTEVYAQILRELEGYYQVDELQVYLEFPRPIVVHITGDQLLARTAPFPPRTRLSSVMDSMMVAIQDSIPFDLRSIELRHNDGNVRNYDMLAYALNGDLDNNPFLSDGDVIVMNPLTAYSSGISVSGAVKRSFNSNFRQGDSLGALLEMAGGATPHADTSYVMISRIDAEDGRSTLLRISNPFSVNAGLPMQANDRVILPFLDQKPRNQFVEISGAVKFPGTYSVHQNGSIVLAELIELAGGSTSDAHHQGTYIVRDTHQTVATLDLITRASDQFVEGLEYLIQEFKTTDSIMFVDIRDESQVTNAVLEHGDKVHIPYDTQSILLAGQVNRTGWVRYNQGDDVAAYIERAGGFGLAADTDRVFIIKAGGRVWLRPDETTIESGDIVFVDRVPYDELQNFRLYTLQKRQARNSYFQLGLSTVATVASIIVTYLAISR